MTVPLMILQKMQDAIAASLGSSSSSIVPHQILVAGVSQLVVARMSFQNTQNARDVC